MPMLLLVVDQHSDARGVYGTALAELECEMMFCDRGEDVLETIADRIPDLVIMDMHLPGMLGTQMLNSIKQLHPDLPVFLCADCNCFFYDARSRLAERCFFKSSELPLLLEAAQGLMLLQGVS